MANQELCCYLYIVPTGQWISTKREKENKDENRNRVLEIDFPRMFPRAELVATTINRGRFLPLIKKKKINLWKRKNPNPFRDGGLTS